MEYSKASQPPVLPPATTEDAREAPASAVEPAASTSTKPKGAAGKKKRTKEADDEAAGQPAAKTAKTKAGARPSQTGSSSKASNAKAASKGTDSKPVTAPSTPKLASEPASAAEPSAYAKMMGAPRLGGLGNMKFKKGGDSKATEIKSFPSAPISIEDTPDTKPVEPAPAVRELPKPKEEDPREAIARRNKQREDMKKRMDAVEKNKFDLLRQSVDMQKFDEAFGIQRKVWTGEITEDQLPNVPLAAHASIARDKPKGLPYPMQYGSGFWLSADQPASAQASVSAQASTAAQAARKK